MSGCEGKDSWPELVGERGETAAQVIASENPEVEAIIVVEGASVTGDFRCDRVWVWVDANGFVDRVPVLG
ncbi:hypothetical protein AAHA92_23662 [Salvia divinorum]|uniref:Proteinase inhibitor n=1 Tax=Salvia divinorum TaxID=28513 RepID=A0ABD1GSQ7_SALDI